MKAKARPSWPLSILLALPCAASGPFFAEAIPAAPPAARAGSVRAEEPEGAPPDHALARAAAAALEWVRAHPLRIVQPPVAATIAPPEHGHDPRCLAELLDRVAALQGISLDRAGRSPSGLDRVAAARGQGRTPVVIFDLDDTLLDSGPRKAKALRIFVSRSDVRREFPRETERVARFLSAPVWRYSLEATLRSIGIGNDEFLCLARRYALRAYFAQDLLILDRAVEGAPAYVSALARAGATIVYLTGRTESIRPATVASLEKNGFRLPDRHCAFLMMKQRSGEDSTAFKKSALASIDGIGEVVGGFDNEPANIDAFHERYPEALMIFPDTLHSDTVDPKTGRPFAVDPGIPWIRNYDLP